MKNRNKAIGAAGLFIVAFTLFFPAEGSAMGRKPKTFSIHMTVDFGPADKPGYSGEFEIEKGTTPKEAVSQVYPVLSGMACCSLRELIEIGGVRIDPAKNHWWVCLLNGSKKVSPRKTELKRGDRVEWRYIEESQ